MRNLLVIDDDEAILQSLSRVLSRRGWSVQTAQSGTAALDLISRSAFQVVCCDYSMPGLNGVEVLREVKSRWPRIQRLMLSGNADLSALEGAVNSGEIFRFIAKPWQTDDLHEVFEAAFKHYDLVDEIAKKEVLDTEEATKLKQLTQNLEVMVAERTTQLTRATHEWRLTFDAIDMPMALLWPDRVIRRTNLAYARHARCDVRELTGRKCHEALFGRDQPCAGCPIDRLGQKGETAAVTGEVEGRDGMTFRAQAYQGGPECSDSVVCVYRDISEEKRLLKGAIHMEKMVALGRLAGAVAHEINNPLGGILAFSQLMLRDAGRSTDDLEALGLIEQSTLRCKRIVDSMLRFSRRGKSERVSMDLCGAIDEALLLFRAMMKPHNHVELIVDLPPSLPSIAGDGNQLQQVVLNMLQNAFQALPQATGRISVRAGAPGGGEVLFEVADTGSGISAADLPNIFDPSFTTKRPGEGTGFGLSISQGIIEAHGGRITVHSRTGEGTTFTVFLPTELATE